jgi:hypothetical protein
MMGTADETRTLGGFIWTGIGIWGIRFRAEVGYLRHPTELLSGGELFALERLELDERYVTRGRDFPLPQRPLFPGRPSRERNCPAACPAVCGVSFIADTERASGRFPERVASLGRDRNSCAPPDPDPWSAQPGRNGGGSVRATSPGLRKSEGRHAANSHFRVSVMTRTRCIGGARPKEFTSS